MPKDKVQQKAAEAAKLAKRVKQKKSKPDKKKSDDRTLADVQQERYDDERCWDRIM